MIIRAGLRILVVEDEWLIAQQIVTVLEEIGHEVIGPANSVGRALALIGASRPDAALLDVSLGGEVSFPIADALTRKGVPFAFLTGYARPDLPDCFASATMLSKPLLPELVGGALSLMCG